MKRIRFQMRTTGGLMLVDGYQAGEHFAVHKGALSSQDPESWRITHIPTGWSASAGREFRTRREAVARVREIEAMELDWSETNSQRLSALIIQARKGKREKVA